MTIRPTNHDDLAQLQDVLTGTDLFTAEMLPDLLGGFLSGEASTEIWLTCEVEGRAIGFCYAIEEEVTDRTWNMRALAVLPSRQAAGHGSALVQHLETVLRGRKQRIVIVDTSGAEAFARTRAFYRKAGYAEEARIRDFWATGDDKIVFWKSLG